MDHAEVAAYLDRIADGWLSHLAFDLDRSVPMVPAQRDRNVLDGTYDLAMRDDLHPPGLWQENPAVAEHDLLGVWVAKTLVPVFAPRLWIRRATLEVV
ncbi:hypothetical protein D3C87_1820710 [compost metagenome]